MVFSNYEMIEKIAEAPNAAVFKACDKSNPGRMLILKILKADNLSENRKLQIRQKIEHLKVLNDPLLIIPASFSDDHGVCFLTQDYFDGITLDKLIETRSAVPLNEFLTIACEVAQALEKVHQAGIIHGGVKPHNILVDPETLNVRLIDFIGTIDVQDVSHFIYEPSFIKGTLAYTSPEQTGRINHRVVFASDLYSLGIVFYETLTGKVPFSSKNDPLEVIHAHLAREATPVHEINPDIPPVLGKIIAKLILKEPEKRYQCSGGLLADLIHCKDEYAALGTIREFPLETSVPANRVTFISRMVGREKEAMIVVDEYEQVASGAFRAMFISGLPGIGKTRLIQELQKPMVQHRGYFTSGKFDIYQKNVPYSSLTQALRNLVHTFLTESDERAAAWKGRILQAVAQNGKVLTDVIPELETLIGKQPDVQPLPPVESLHRFHDVCGRFLTCLATKEHPLILFIDDLQWCDAASFDFLSEVFHNHRDHRYLLLLGAYRHNEVDPSHPLSRLIRTVQETKRPFKEILLDALRPEHCHEMVSHILDSPPEQTGSLAQYLSALTEGNPLFVSESLAYLYNEGLLHLGSERQWQWDIAKIRESCMPTTVVNLFSSKIQKLQHDVLNLLQYCACIGNVVSPTELSSIRELPLQEIFETLKPALEQGLVIENGSRLQFLHDRVQEAVLSSIPEERRRRMHWEIGTRLRALVPEGITDFEYLDNLFAIVAHLNLGIDENPGSETAYFVSDLNYRAGNKALDSLAVDAANKYFNRSRELLPYDCWESRYERTFEIFRKTAKTELMCGYYEKSEKLLNELIAHATTDLDRAECLAEQTVSLSSTGNFSKAIDTANRGLGYFGKAIPASLDEVNKKREELMAEIAAKDTDIRKTILSMAFTTDRKKKVESAFYSELLADLYFSRRVPELYLVAAQSTLHALDGGMDEGMIYGFTAMGLYHGEQEEFEQSFLYEDLTLDLAAKYPNTFAATKSINGATWTMMHTRSHPKKVVEYSLKAFQSGKSCGDTNNAAIAYGPAMWNLQIQGAELKVIEDYARECLQFASRYHVPLAARLAEATQAGWIAPMKTDFTPASMEETLGQWERDHHSPALANYCMHRAQAHYYFGEHEEAERELARAEGYVNGVINSVLKRGWYVFKVLNAIKLYEKRTGSKSKRKLMAEIKPFITRITKWASLGPVFKPYLAFIRAELERVAGEFREARSLYLDAIDAAHEQEYAFLAGHLNECVGELLRQAGQHSDAGYFVEAIRLYRNCGAERKEQKLIGETPPPLTTTNTATLPELDIEYLMKSSLAISAETEQAALLDKIMEVIIESSGAQHGYLIMEDAGKLFVCAESHVTEEEPVRTLNQRIEDAEGICKAIVRYVQRTGEKVILDDACREGMFKGNPEVQQMELRSVLCLPVVNQSRMFGKIFLENRLLGSVFTPDKVRMTELLASQAAVSLENARLVEDLKEAKGHLEIRVQERTAELAEANSGLQKEITERKRAEESAAAERQRLYDVLETLPVYVCLLDSDYHIPFANRYFRETFGESHGRRCHDFLFNRTEPCEICETYTVMKTWEPHHWYWTGPNGSDYDIYDFPFTDNDGSMLILEMGIDITERKQAEDALKQTLADLTRSNQDLQQFAYVASHDLQEPLRNVASCLQMLEKKYKDNLDAEADKLIHYAVEGAVRMKALIMDLLTYSRVATRGKPPERLDSEQVLDQALKNLRVALSEAGAFLTHDPLPTIFGDDTELVQVFQNLIHNAIKFRNDAPPKVHVSAVKNEYEWMFSVKDNGIGIESQHLDRIFVIFQRLNKRSQYGGTGMGLAIVKKVVERHGGRVWVESEPGAGSTFYFTIPDRRLQI